MRRRLAALTQGEALDRDLTDEMRFHLDMETEDLMRMKGLSRDEAERQARVRFGGVDKHAEAQRDERGVRPLAELGGDLRYAWRALRRTPTFAISAILVLALGIGAGTAIFSAVNTVVVSHLPYPDDDQLVRIFVQNSPTNRFGLSVADLRGIEQLQRTLSGVGALVTREIPVRAGNSEPTRQRVAAVNAGLFNTLGIRVAAGRPLTRADEDPGAPAVVIISDAFARANFGGPASAIDKTVDLDGSPSRVIGVLPPGVHDLAGVKTEIWPSYQPQTPRRRGPFLLTVVGRRKPGVSMQTANADLKTVARKVFPLWTKNFPDTVATYTAIPLRDAIVRDAPKTLWLFAAAAALLLLTAMTNVANLMLARIAARGRELSLRLVLGASRLRITRLVLVESLAVSVAGAVGGLVLGALLLKAVVAVNPTMPRLANAHVDGWALAFAASAAIVTALVIGIHPALTLMRGNAGEAMGSHREISGLHGSRTRGALVAIEFALALPLLAAAGQLVTSLRNLQAVDPGFDPARVAFVRVVLPQARYDSVRKVIEFWEAAARRVKEVPGVVASGYATELPPADVSGTNDFRLAGSTLPPGAAAPQSPWAGASPGYFDVLGVKLLQGRMFTGGDTLNSSGPMLVSESWAKRYSPDQPVVGRRIYSGGCDDSCTPEYIVGVVSDVKYTGLANGGEAAYEPGVQGMPRSAYLFVKTRGEPAAVLPGVRAAIAQIDPTAPVDQLSTLEDRLYESTAAPRHWATLITGFAIAALALAAVGIFGLLSYLVMMMRREIGVRVALGAQRIEIMRMVLRRGLLNSATGAVVGIALAAAGRKLLAASLYKEAAGAPMTLGVTAVVLLAVAAGACLLPAMKAARVDAMEAIRDG